MLIKEKKHSKEDLVYQTFCLQKCDDDFIILDDCTTEITKEVNEIFNLIKKFGYQLKVIDCRKYSIDIVRIIKEKNINFDTVVLAGTGGKQVFESIKDDLIFNDKNIYSLKWNREWENDISLGFDTDIDKYDFKDKNVIIVEDVIASGNTLWTMKKEIEKLNGKVNAIFSILIQESSPLINNSFCPIYSIITIKKPKDETLDPFWYPPIYSLRHLLYGDSEMPSIYKLLNNKYFNNSDEIECAIKKLRKDIK